MIKLDAGFRVIAKALNKSEAKAYCFLLLVLLYVLDALRNLLKRHLRDVAEQHKIDLAKLRKRVAKAVKEAEIEEIKPGGTI